MMTTTAATSLQQQAWVGSLRDDAGARTISVMLRFGGQPDPRLVAALFKGLVRRHDALRTSFTREDPQRCVIADPADAQVEFDAVGQRPDDDSLRGYLAKPFPLTTAVRIRGRLMPDGDGGSLMAVAADHLAMDYVSLRLGLQPSPTGAAAPQYAAFAATQRELLAGDWGTVRRAYWHQHFARWGPGHPRSPVGNRQAASAPVETIRWRVPVGEEFGSAMEQAAASHRTSMFGLFTAAILLAQLGWGDEGSVGVVTDFHGRVLPASRSTIGLFSHGTRICLDRSEARDLAGAVQVVHRRIGEVRRYALPLRPLAAGWLAGRGPSPAEPPFVYVCTRPRQRSLTTVASAHQTHIVDVGLRTAANTADRGLSLVLEDRGGDAVVNVRFDANCFAPDDVAALLAETFELIGALAGTSERPSLPHHPNRGTQSINHGGSGR